MGERIPIGADHAGYALKEQLKMELARLGYEPVDVGAYSDEPSDYPDYARPVAAQVSRGEARRGVLTCGSGLGMGYVANRLPRVRAAVAWSPEVAELARRHNDANILILPSRFMSEADALEAMRRWLAAPFDGGRHERRVAKIEGDT